MANKAKDLSFLNPSLNKKIIKSIQQDIDKAYSNTYYTDPNDSTYIDAIRRRMDKDINGLIDKTKLHNNGNNMSYLYSRTMASDDEGMIKEFKKVLQDESMLSDLMDMYSQNAVQRDLDREIDVICKYVPKLEKALKIKADHVLCADHFNKDNIIYNLITNEQGRNSPDSTNDTGSQYAAKSDLEAFKKKYHLEERFKRIYNKTAKYGESFIYIVSYNKAINRLLKKTSAAQGGALFNESEELVLDEATVNKALSSVNESVTFVYGPENAQERLDDCCYALDESTDMSTKSLLSSLLKEESSVYDSIEVEFNTSGVIPSMISEVEQARKVLKISETINEADGLASSGRYLSNSSYLKNMNDQFKKFAKEGGHLKSPENLAIDGFMNVEDFKKKQTVKNNEQINIPGCIVRELDHTMVKSYKVEDMTLGYCYVEANRDMNMDVQTTFSSTLGGLRPRRSTRRRENMDRPAMDDQVLIKISKKIAEKIDAKFVNANQDIANEIYTILKYNAEHGNGKVSKIRISFIPPEDIIHVYFELNEKTKRGISDLHKSMFPAKLLSCLYISNVIALITRGYDKRAYYVRNNVDTNISQVLLNVINQIKQSNFNLRQIENMNNILNITGRFNDYVIPRNMNGESPIDFEIIPGQNIEVKTEFMRMLEDQAVEMTGVTSDQIGDREQVQTATHITMTNAQFLIMIFERQQKYQNFISEIATKIYQNEYGTEDEIEVKLPPPIMLNFTNTSQMLSVANDVIQNIATMKLGPNQMDEGLKNAFVGKLMEFYLKSFIPMEEINKLYDEAKVELAQEKIPGQPDPNAMAQG